MTSRGGSGHIGSVFSCADIVAVLYGRILAFDPAHPGWPERDRFILSKGHAAAVVYAVLAEFGFLPLQKLETHFQDGSGLCG
ncbi:MAG: transketolase, partial [Acidobacteriota bacterium]